jgi:hypothetical protein
VPSRPAPGCAIGLGAAALRRAARTHRHDCAERKRGELERLSAADIRTAAVSLLGGLSSCALRARELRWRQVARSAGGLLRRRLRSVVLSGRHHEARPRRRARRRAARWQRRADGERSRVTYVVYDVRRTCG